ncbi:MAG: BamA/TamA family outer membrane protein [Opitutaceae bacterium]|nr:BamA/TamA family outer membrane protein [Opitutaceae bacterium]
MIACLLGCATVPVRAGADAEATPVPASKAPARVTVEGLGFWGNREMRATLGRLFGEDYAGVLDRNAIEDAVFLVMSSLQDEGFLAPTVRLDLKDAANRVTVLQFESALSAPLPPELSVQEIAFRIDRGIRAVVDQVTISLVPTTRGPGAVSSWPGELSKEQMTEYFINRSLGFGGEAGRAFSPSRLRHSADSLVDVLRNRGYADAVVVATADPASIATGKVAVSVEVSAGLRSEVTRVEIEGLGTTGVVVDTGPWVGVPWTPFWQQDLTQEIRRVFFLKGYPDVTVSMEQTTRGESGGGRELGVVAQVKPGPRVFLGTVGFTGQVFTKESVLRRRARLQSGSPFNPLRVEQARARLARLGVFSSVLVKTTESDDATRDVGFELREFPRNEANLLLGYGSYERLRGGVEWRRSNLFGAAHQGRLTVVQSMKSSHGDYLYSVPELFGETVDGTARLYGLRREERSFVREEYGGTLALRRRFGRRGLEGSVGYAYEVLSNRDNELTTRTSDDDLVKVGSVEAGLTLDRRDNPLRPRHGYRGFFQVEAASRDLGGEVDYQVCEFGASYHTSMGQDRWIHLGLTHGVITTFGASSDRDLPVNKRFFPGGESSIRGYSKGEAAPRGVDGRFVGAKSQITVNIEVEQALSEALSAIAFVDGLGTAVSLRDYPFRDRLISAGLGLRYQTIVGPVRLEYGRNLNPRQGDPRGTLHVAVGFPF